MISDLSIIKQYDKAKNFYLISHQLTLPRWHFINHLETFLGRSLYIREMTMVHVLFRTNFNQEY